MESRRRPLGLRSSSPGTGAAATDGAAASEAMRPAAIGAPLIVCPAGPSSTTEGDRTSARAAPETDIAQSTARM